MGIQCSLVLDDGTVFQGMAFGAEPASAEGLTPDSAAVGEVVFNTGMTGYHEILTDPSYTGQIVTMTYPHIGNYGDDDDWSETGPESDPGRRGIKARALVVRSLYRGPVPEGRLTLDEYLKREGVSGITGVDTRKLTLKLRSQGSRKGVIVKGVPGDGFALPDITAFLGKVPDMEGANLLPEVGTDQLLGSGSGSGEAGVTLALIDCGIKANILRELEKRGAAVKLFPSTATADEILKAKVDAVFFSNGPGDPGVLDHQAATAKALLGKLPVLGICLGHQIIGRALGAATYKMKFGHHGVNHPVRDEKTKKVFVTSQNHGFAVDEKSLPGGTSVWFRNANDGSVEGLRCPDRKAACVQFHPEAAPGPHDAVWIFDEFIAIAKKGEVS